MRVKKLITINCFSPRGTKGDKLRDGQLLRLRDVMSYVVGGQISFE